MRLDYLSVPDTSIRVLVRPTQTHRCSKTREDAPKLALEMEETTRTREDTVATRS